jgi:hypothetical protein
MKKTILILFVIAAGISAQPIGFGVKGGVPFTDLFDGSQNTLGSFESKTKRYIVGPMVELRLPLGFAIEADALYSQANLSSVIEAAGSLVSAATDANSWEFPVVLKKKFGGADAIAASVRPYVEAGASFRKFTGLKDLPAFVTGSGGNIDSNNTGFVIGGGLEIRALFLRVSPEVRFTRWGSDNFLGGLANVWKTNRNQGQFLVGISF